MTARRDIRTGGHVDPAWTTGWAVHPLRPKSNILAHWFQRQLAHETMKPAATFSVTSLCMRVTALETKVIVLLEPGNAYHCKRCAMLRVLHQDRGG